LGALGAKGAGSARFGIKLDGVARLERLHLTGGAGDGLGAQVDLEVGLGKQAGAVGPLAPGLGEDATPRGKDVIDDGAVDVGAVDMQFDETEALSLDVLRKGHGAQFFGSIRRRHGAGDDRRESRSRVMCSL
jgi:hypothetical protein